MAATYTLRNGSLVMSRDELAYLSSFLQARDRAGFYIAYYNMTGSEQAFEQAQVATFSDAKGGTAISANRLLQDLYGPVQYEGIYSLSQKVAESSRDVMKEGVDRKGTTTAETGFLSGPEFFTTAFKAWVDNGQRDQFPGNGLLVPDSLTLQNGPSLAILKFLGRRYVDSIVPPPHPVFSAAAYNATQSLLTQEFDAVQSARRMFPPVAIPAVGSDAFDYFWQAYLADDDFRNLILGSSSHAGQIVALLGMIDGVLLGKKQSDYAGIGEYTAFTTPDGRVKVESRNETANLDAAFDLGPLTSEERLLGAAARAMSFGYASAFANGRLSRSDSSSAAQYRRGLRESNSSGNSGDVNPRIPSPSFSPALQWTLRSSGTAAKDTLWSSQLGATINAGAGEDFAFGGGSRDILNGDSGGDVLYGRDGRDELHGGGDNDVLRGGGGADLLYGEAGDDVLDGADFNPETKDGIDKLYGGAGEDVLFGGEFGDFLYGEGDADQLIGGRGADTLEGGVGSDKYLFKKLDGKDIITDSDGQGSIFVGSDDYESAVQLTGGTRVLGKSGNPVWTSADGKFTYRLTAGDLSTGATIEITGSELGRGDSISITDVVIPSPSDRFLGLQLDPERKTSLEFGRRTNGFRTEGYTAPSGLSRTLTEGASSIVSFATNARTKAGSAIKLLLQGEFKAAWRVITGDQILSPDANGEITIALPEGKTETSLALWNKDDVDTDSALTVSATYLENGSVIESASSNTLTLNLDAREEAAGLPVTTRDILGDRVHETAPGGGTLLDDLGNPVTTNNPDPNKEDFRDSQGNDNIRLGGSARGTLGVDYVRAEAGGDDLIWQEVPGRIWARAGAGNDVLIGGTGAPPPTPTSTPGLPASQDMLMGGAGDDRIFGQDVAVLEDAIATGNTEAPNNVEGDFLSGGAGEDLIVAGNERDIVAGGGGRDVIVGGAGGDLLFGDANYEAADVLALGFGGWGEAGISWVESEMAGTTIFTVQNTHPGGVGDPADSAGDVVYGGEGADAVLGGAGGDSVYGEAGNDRMWGDAGDDLLLGGAGDDVLAGDNGESFLAAALHGSDFVDGGEGNDRLFGNQGADALFGGVGDDLLTGDSSDTNAGDDYLDGEAGNDELIGAGGADTLYGGEGNDLLSGDANNVASEFHGEDIIDGEEGNDQIAGGGGVDAIFGGEGADTIEGDGLDSSAGAQGADFVDGGAGDDIIEGNGGDDTIFGGDGADGISGDSADDPAGSAGNDTIDGGAGDDTVIGAGGDDTIIGGAGDDTLAGDSADTAADEQGDDFLSGGEGADELQGHGGDDALEGGEGDDIASGGEGDDTLELGAGDDQATGNEGNDSVSGGDGSDQVFGEAGDDTLDGGDGDDNLISGGAGDDVLSGGGGSDFLQGDLGSDTLAGGDGADLYGYTLGDGADHIQDTGSNTLLLHGISPFLVEIGLGSLVLTFGNPGDEIHLDNFDPDNVAAGAGVDTFVFDDGTVLTYDQLIARGFTIRGTPDADLLDGTSAGDTISALGSNDVVIGKAGDDTLDLGAGDDIAEAGEGSDTVTAGEGGDLVFGGAGNDSISGGSGIDRLLGEEGHDTLEGGDDGDALEGGAGDDTLAGDAGGDALYGDEGADRLHGGEGTDLLDGGADDDVYVIDDTLDAIVESAGGGNDAIESSISYTIAENVEQLRLTGTADLTGTGNAVGNTLSGNDGNNLLVGLEGDDRLFGEAGEDVLDGGAGADVLNGGAGDDLYLVESEGDTVGEEQDFYDREVILDASGNVIGFGTQVYDGGEDTVESSVSFALPQFIENLTLTSGAIEGTGTVEANTLTGNDEANVLYAHRLNGEADLYPTGIPFIQQFSVVRNAAEELLADKANSIIFRGGVAWFVPQEVEMAPGSGDLLIGNAGADLLYGSLDDDTLLGGEGNDLLYGFAGADTMEGGAGDDTYVVSGVYGFLFGYAGGDRLAYSDEGAAGDALIEGALGGVDTVVSEVDFALGEEFENLRLVFDTRDYDPGFGAYAPISASPQRQGRAIARVGEGNALDNVLTGHNAGVELYGYGGADTLIGGSGFDLLDGGTGADLMQGGSGDDTYIVEDAGDSVSELGSGADTVESSIDYTLTANVENLTLTGGTFTESLSGTGNELANVILGNAGDNALSGLAGDDVLDGGAGADAMTGGAGDDRYYVDSEADTTTEALDEGHDTVYSTQSHALGANLEDLFLTGGNGDYGHGNALDNLIVGDASANELIGAEGDDTLEAGEGADTLEGGAGDDSLQGGADADQMAGGAGDDAYHVDSEGDSVTEFADEGIDTVHESLSFYSIGANVENAVILGELQDLEPFGFWQVLGNELDNAITGNDGQNFLSAQGGADSVDARAGNDQIRGDQGGDDLYGGDDALRPLTRYIDSSGEEVPSWWEGAKPVNDRFELAQNSDEIYGGEGEDAIDGGSGDDRLSGDEGDDFLYGGDDGLVGDEALPGGGEEGGGGIGQTPDGRVFLANNDTLEGGGGEDVLDGGSGDDALYGGEGDDVLRGGADGPLNTTNRDTLDGGAGIDFMAGGTGDDQYIVDGFFTETDQVPVYDLCGEVIPGAITRLWTTDTVLEAAGEGYDSVFSSADFVMPEHVERLELLNFADARNARGSSGDNEIVGNGFDNRLEGGAGNDRLLGRQGDDLLDGGAGDDTYLFAPGAGRDIVFDSNGNNRVHMAPDLSAADVVLSRQGDDVIIGLAGTGDRMVLAGWFDTTNRVRSIEFCDDPAWDEATIAALANARANQVEAQDDDASVQEDAAPQASGNVLANDTAFDPAATLTVANPGTRALAYGTLDLAADGSFTYTLDNAAVQSLGEGESRADGFTYEALDTFGSYAFASLEIEIAGQNDAPELSPGGTGAVVEDAGTLVRFPNGSVLVDGAFDSGLAFWDPQGNTGFTGTDFLAQSGMAAYSGAIGAPTLLGQEVETLAGARYLLEFYLLGGADSGAEFAVNWNGATLLTLTDTGLADEFRRYQVELEGTGEASRLEFSLRNDPGFWHLDEVSLGLLAEDFIVANTQQAEGALEFTDLDASDAHSLAIEPRGGDYLGALDAFIEAESFDGATGTVRWNFFADNAALQLLAEGETREQVYDLTLTDPFGGSATQSVTITLTGVNDAPESADTFAFAAEDDVLTAEGNVLDNVFDIDEADVLTVATPGTTQGAYGTLDIAADGSYLYTLDNDSLAVQSLAGGDSVEDVFEIEVTDGIEVVASTLFVEIDGENDAPVAIDDAAAVREDSAPAVAGNVLGNDSDVDSNDVLQVSSPGSFAGNFGTLTLAADGAYAYALDNNAVQALAEGETVTDAFGYEATDGDLAASGTLTVTVAGANDAPQAGAISGAAQEDGPAITLAPQYLDVDAFDVHTIAASAYGNAGFERGDLSGWTPSDAGLAEVLAGGAQAGDKYASLRSGAGADAYTTLARTVVLEAGESVSGFADFVVGDALPYDDDGYVSIRLIGGPATTLFAASVASVGDYGESGWAAFAFAAPEAGTYVLEAGVRNALDNTVASRLLLDGVETARPAAGVTVNAGGTLGYDPGGRFEWLAEGETATDSFLYTVTDNHGAQESALASVTIAGANDAPEIVAADLAGTVSEDNALSGDAVLGVQGSVTFADVDLSDAHEVQVGTLDSDYLGELSATLVADSTGGGAGSLQWSFAVENGALDYLGEGETLEQAYEVLVADAFGGSDARIVTVTLAGVNDGPVAAHDAASVQEDGILEATGNVLGNDSDVDLGDVLQVAMPGTFLGSYGTLTLSADGGYTYALDNALAQSLAAGETFDEAFAYRATDGLASSEATLTVTVTGANDAPAAADDAAAVQEDGVLEATGNVLANDFDVDLNDVLQVATPGTFVGSYGTLSLAADGVYSYVLDNALAQSLAAGQHVEDEFAYSAFDGSASATGTLRIDIAGANDAPVTADDAASVAEDGVLVASGNVLANDSDVDSGTTLTVANAGVYGGLALEDDGGYVYTLDNASAAVQGLRAGEVVTDGFVYFADDGIAQTSGTLEVSITGANDAPAAGDDGGVAQEDGPAVTLLASALLANDTDVDAGDTKAISAVTNSAAGAQVTLSGGNSVYDVGGLFQTLKEGATATDTFTYTVIDGAGAESTATVTMAIAGVNDAPVLANAIADQDAQAGAAWNFVFSADTFADIDAGDTLAYAATQGDGSALPAWLTFNPATRTFAGTPPSGTGGGGDGDDCGCGTGGGTAPATLDLRVIATDTGGASANDAFVLNIAGGGGRGIVPIVGTERDDVLTGTGGDDVIDGREGYDRMAGGAGDDVYYVDKTHGRVDLVTENPGEGYDTVYSQADYTLGSDVEELHLVGDEDLEGKGNALENILVGNTGDNRLRGEGGDDLLLDDRGRDRLEGGAGDDVLDGGAGDDTLEGGSGNDLYVYTRRGGDDVVRDSGGTDAIRFGEGITQSQVAVRRSGNDLKLQLSGGGNGSVTVKDWFASSAKRVESVQFADGASWDEAQIRARLERSGGGGHGGGDGDCGGDDDRGRRRGRGGGHDRDDDGWDGHHGGRHDHKDHHHGRGDCEDCGTDELRDAIAQRLRRRPNYDFTALSEYLARNGGYGAMSAAQIAAQWSAVQNCVGSLAKADDDDGCHGHGGHHGHGWDRDDDERGHGRHGWGHGGSIGRRGGWGGMEGFCGLGEGFRRL